ncbi:MAG: hypothetical protein JSU94_19495 [Phycisphaerales bacterium]|nr:MAG: hypothetical protein JSU94_19495 [Phycisphaerales bacterium]
MVTTKARIMVVLALLSLAGRCTAQGSISQWNLGEVPSKTVWHGESCLFLVQWEGHPECAMAMRADPAPNGPIGLAPTGGEYAGWWTFYYAPCGDASCGADKFPFMVTLVGRDGDEVLNQSFELTPLANLGPEQVVFDPANHTQSDPVEVDDPDPQITKAAGKTWMNHKYVSPRTVLIRRQTIEIEQGHANNYYTMFDGAGDIEEMEMIAEKVIIRSPLHLPQTNVIIRADELVMEGAGAAIITTPMKNEVPADDLQPGDNGLDAGDITLEVGELLVTHPGTQFDLRGGSGQDGGDGADGAPGKSAASYWKTFEWTDSGIHFSWTAPEGEWIIYEEAYCTCLMGIPIFAFDYPPGGITEVPTSGSNAKPSGKPGKGGRGGTLKTTVSTATAYADVSPGIPGRTPPQRLDQPWKTKYYGGAAGWPNKWLKMKAHYCFTAGFSITASYNDLGPTVAGADALVVQPDAPSAGDYGSCVIEGTSFGWIDPIAMDLLFGRAKDLYLNGRLDEAQARMEELSETLETYMADAAWASVPPDSQRDLRKMYDQMKTLLYQIGNNLDYYGNPAGWVPMLSFEVNTTLFDSEIDRAIDMLYLGHWIGKTSATLTQRRDALLELHAQLVEEKDKAIEDYDEAMQNLGTLQIRAGEIRQRMEQAILSIQSLENYLKSQADANTQTPWWKTGLKMAAVMCKVIPLVQPAAGYIGTGMEMAASFDPNKPYDTVLEGTQLVDQIISTQLDTVATGVGAAANAATGDVGDAAKFIVDSLGVSKTGLTDYVTGMKAALDGIHAPADKVKAELERLKALSPEFKSQAERIEDLQAQQGELARDTAQTLLKLTSLADLITENLLALDTLREDLASQPTLDPRAAMYVNALNRRAVERLLKYHYYMAKAYEYRLLKPYTQALNLDDLMDELANSVGPDGDVIPAEQFATLKGIYRDAIATVAEEIFTMYNNNPPELSAPVRFNLTPEEIAAINAGETVRLNLMDLGVFPSSDENVRIVDFKVYQIATQAVGGSYEQNAYVDLRIEHSGLSKLMSAGQTYLFRHYNRQTTNPITWGARYFPVDDDVIPIAPGAATASLLRSLLSGDAVSDMMLYSRPSVWADLEFSMSVHNNAGKDIDLSTLRLELQYDFVERNADLRLCDIQLQVATAEPPEGTAKAERTFMPYFVLGTPDKNQRLDARGWVHRIYPVNELGSVEIRAQQKYGDWKFNKWTNQYGQDLAEGPWLDPLLKVVPDMDQAYAAQYVPLYVLEADINSDCVVDFADFATMAAAWMSVFPMISLDEQDAMEPIGMTELVMLSDQWCMTCEEMMQGMTVRPKAMVELTDLRRIEFCEGP